MSFFVQARHPTTFNPLFHFLNEVDSYGRGGKQCQPQQRRHVKTFTPKFDVAETATAYQLYGELPGVEQKDVEIEFTDRQTLTVSGRRERQLPALESTTPSSEVKGKAVESDSASHKATVEDDFEEINGSEASSDSTAENTEATTATTETTKPTEETPKVPQPKFWVAERGAGSFSRSFEFSEGIDQAGVQASMKNGVLSIVVPKKPFEAKKVVIN